MGIVDGALDALGSLTWKDVGDIGKSAFGYLKDPEVLKGIGGLAGAWGSYKTGKAASDFANKQYNYQVEQDEYAKKKKEAAQAAIDQAWAMPVTTGA